MMVSKAIGLMGKMSGLDSEHTLKSADTSYPPRPESIQLCGREARKLYLCMAFVHSICRSLALAAILTIASFAGNL